MRNLIDRVVEALKPGNALPDTSIESESVTAAPQIREPRCETDDQPVFQIERLKENFLHHLKCFVERLESLDLGGASVHSDNLNGLINIDQALTARPAIFVWGPAMERATSRRYPIGAELIGPNQTHFRVWAPKAQDV